MKRPWPLLFLPLALCVPSGAGAWPLSGNGPGMVLSGVNSLEAARLKPVLRQIAGGKIYDGRFLRDAVRFIQEQMAAVGFPSASVEISLYQGGKLIFSRTVAAGGSSEIDPSVRGDSVRFLVHSGRREIFSRLSIAGIHALGRRECVAAFYPNAGLYTLPSERFFTEKRLATGILRLTQQLHRQGFRDAVLQSRSVERNGHRNRVKLEWREGPLHRIGAVAVEWLPNGEPALPLPPVDLSPLPAADDAFIAGQLHAVRSQLHAAGHADARLSHRLEPMAGMGGGVDRLIISVEAGCALCVGAVRCDGRTANCGCILIRPGDPLNPDRIAADRDRLRALGTGCWSTAIGDGGERRDVEFISEAKKHDELFAYLGGGSYDIARIGLEWKRSGTAAHPHTSHLRVFQSFRRSMADYDYLIPKKFGPNGTVHWNARFLRMEEGPLVRRDAEMGITLEKHSPRGIRRTLSYSWGRLSANRPFHSGDRWMRMGRVSAFQCLWERNRLDNPIYPTSGDRRCLQLEVAVPILGGNSQYERAELDWSLHHRLGNTTIFHGNVRHGAIHTLGNPADRLPFNRRFFCGGVNSVRGFREGRASPIDGDNRIVGAAAYALLRLELEQRLLNRLSGFIFSDGIGFCEAIGHYPADTYLIAGGGGFAFHTAVGPLRVSQTWNLRRRPMDRRHCLTFSIGFPF